MYSTLCYVIIIMLTESAKTVGYTNAQAVSVAHTASVLIKRVGLHEILTSRLEEKTISQSFIKLTNQMYVLTNQGICAAYTDTLHFL